jgi:hypothetical protein
MTEHVINALRANRTCLSVHDADAYTPTAPPAYIALLRRLMSRPE